jgi:hypothetical protein
MKITNQKAHTVMSYCLGLLQLLKKLLLETGQNYISKGKLVEWQPDRIKYRVRCFM